MKRFNVFTVLVFCFLSSSLTAQVDIGRQTLAVGSHTGSSVDYTLTSTFGQTVVGTVVNGSFILTQGFQQPDESQSTTSNKPEELRIGYRLFPIPADQFINLHFSETPNQELTLALYDIAGKVFLQKTLNNDLRHQIELTTIPSGTYVIKILDRVNLEMDAAQLIITH